jgi:hypothetical protein
MTTQLTGVNGRTRKTLAHQLDRLDSILDGFADALNESVADAIKGSVADSVREAVSVAVREVLAHQHAAATEPPPAPEPAPTSAAAKPALWARLKTTVWSVVDSVRQGVITGAGVVAQTTRRVITTATSRTARWAVTAGLLVKVAIGVVRGHQTAGWWGVGAGVSAALACGLGHPLVAALVGVVAVGLLTAALTIIPPVWRLAFAGGYDPA